MVYGSSSAVLLDDQNREAITDLVKMGTYGWGLVMPMYRWTVSEFFVGRGTSLCPQPAARRAQK
jgi:hypothetical protein